MEDQPVPHSQAKDNERIAWPEPRDQKLADLLHTDPIISKAFRRLCKAGYDPVSFEARIIALPMYKKERSRKHYSAADLRKLRRAIRNLRDAALTIAEFSGVFFVTDWKQWSISPLEVPAKLANVAWALEETLKSPLMDTLRTTSFWDRIPYLIDEVTRYTKKPRYADMATLIGAAIEDPEFSEDQLKMIVLRHRQQRKQKGNAPDQKAAL